MVDFKGRKNGCLRHNDSCVSASDPVHFPEGGLNGRHPNLGLPEARAFGLTGIGTGRTLIEQLRGQRIGLWLSLDRLLQLPHNRLASLERGGGLVASLMRVLDALPFRNFIYSFENNKLRATLPMGDKRHG